MTVNNVVRLGKGQRVSLAKEQPGMNFITIMLDWDANRYASGPKLDADITAFCAKRKPDGSGHILSRGVGSMAFYGNPVVGENAVVHHGDDTDGTKREFITIDTSKVNIAEIDEIAIVSTIFKYKTLGLNFGRFENCVVKIYATPTAPTLDTIQTLSPQYVFELTEDMSTMTSAHNITVYPRVDAASGAVSWSLTPIGEGYTTGLADFCRYYGLEVADEDQAV